MTCRSLQISVSVDQKDDLSCRKYRVNSKDCPHKIILKPHDSLKNPNKTIQPLNIDFQSLILNIQIDLPPEFKPVSQ